MNASTLQHRVQQTKSIINKRRRVLSVDDVFTANLYLESISFYSTNGDQARANSEYQKCLTYLDTLTLTQKHDVPIVHFKEKTYIKLWFNKERERLRSIFLSYQKEFNCGTEGKHWIASLDIQQIDDIHYNLEVLISNDTFFITAIGVQDCHFLYKVSAVSPSIVWLGQHLQSAFNRIAQRDISLSQ